MLIPLVLIFDPRVGITICKQEEISPEVLTEFISNYNNGIMQPDYSALPFVCSPFAPSDGTISGKSIQLRRTNLINRISEMQAHHLESR